MSSRKTGKQGEDIAADYLKKKRYKILARNWQNKWGEIDIVASPPHQKFWCGGKHKRKIVFVEVKTLRLTTLAQGKPFLPEDQINEKKRRQLVKMAQIYLLQNKLPLNTPHQIDIFAIELIGEQTKIRHLENALEDIF